MSFSCIMTALQVCQEFASFYPEIPDRRQRVKTISWYIDIHTQNGYSTNVLYDSLYYNAIKLYNILLDGNVELNFHLEILRSFLD